MKIIIFLTNIRYGDSKLFEDYAKNKIMDILAH